MFSIPEAQAEALSPLNATGKGSFFWSGLNRRQFCLRCVVHDARLYHLAPEIAELPLYQGFGAGSRFGWFPILIFRRGAWKYRTRRMTQL